MISLRLDRRDGYKSPQCPATARTKNALKFTTTRVAAFTKVQG